MRKFIIQWSLKQISNMYHSKKEFGNCKNYGIDHISELDDSLCVTIKSNKQINNKNRNINNLKVLR